MGKPKWFKDIPSAIGKRLPKTAAEWGVVVANGLQITAAATAILTILEKAPTPDAALSALAVLIPMLGEDVIKKRFGDFVDRLKGKEKLTVEAIAKRVAEVVKEDKVDLKPLLDETKAAALMLKEAADQNQVEVLAAIVDSRDAILDAILASNKDLKAFITELLSRPKPLPTLHTLRSPVADFTGREAEIKELVAALSREGCNAALLSSIHGMGGVGKTELARKVGHELMGQYPDAQLEWDLQPGGIPVSSESLLTGTISAFAPQVQLPGSLQELEAAYRSALYGKRGLLLLDNAADNDQVKPLLPPPADWAVIVTSRQRFAPHAARMVDLDVLPPEEAHALLRRILHDGDRTATVSEVAKLAELCGHLPLALRIAADFLVVYKDWPVAEYLQALEKERLKYLNVPGKQSVFSSLGISVTQLRQDAPELAARWRLLAVFPAPFDRDAAAAVWGVADDISRDTLSELHRRSLVGWNEKDGVYSLHDLLREYAMTPPLPGGWDDARRRHAAHYLQVGSAANELHKQKGGVVEGLQRFDAAWPHLLAAWDWMSRAGDPAAARWLSDFDGVMSLILALRLTPRQRIPFLEVALDAARRLGDKQDEGIHLGHLGVRYADLGDLKRAIGFYEQALAIVRETGDRRSEGTALGNLGLAYADLGDPKRAIGFYEQALVIDREIGDRRGEGNALGNLGIAYKDLGDPKRAIGFYEQQLVITREIGDRRGEGNALGNLGIAYKNLGDPKRAIRFYEQRLEIAREIGDRTGEAKASWNFGLLYEQQGDFARAADLMQVCVDYERSVGHPDAEKHAARVAELRKKVARA